LYGGGGIAPDVYVPLDNILLDTNLNVFFRNNLLSFFAYKFYLQHKNKIQSFGSVETFNTKFEMDAPTFSALLKETHSNTKLNLEQQHFIHQRFKAMLGRLEWGQSASTYILNTKDQTFLKAIQTLR
jgi:carboxyl-terminal processing protease